MPILKRLRRPLAYALTIILMIVLILEILLRLTDPWGIYLFKDYEQMHGWFEADEAGAYWLPEGDYKLTRRSFRILPDHTRYLPATNPDAPCKIVLIGDSMTFGHDVADDLTWPNIFASEFPNVHFINAANVGYTSEQIRQSMARFLDADGFIYFLIGNDIETTSPLDPRLPYPKVRYWSYYYEYARWQRILVRAEFPEQPRDEARFWDDLAYIFAQEPILVFGYDSEIMPLVQARYPQAIIIPEYTDRISTMDWHPNPKGHEFIAKQIRPDLTSFLNQTCDL